MRISLRHLFLGSLSILVIGGVVGMSRMQNMRGALLSVVKTSEQEMKIVFDEDQNGIITDQEYRKGMRQSLEKIAQEDPLYDINNDGKTSMEDMKSLVQILQNYRRDECPEDVLKQKKGVCGCFVPDKDENGNGIMDCMDDTGRADELLPPSGLFASVFALSNTNAIIKLTWNDNSPNEDAFIIERKIENGAFRELKTVEVNSKETINGNLVPNTEYTYRIRAKRGSQTSEPSKEITIRTTPFYLDRQTICQQYSNREVVPLPDYYKIYQGVGDGRTNNYGSLRSARGLVARTGTGAIASDTNPIFLIFPTGKYLVDEYLFKSFTIINDVETSTINNIQWTNLSYVRFLGCGKVQFSTSGKYRRTITPREDGIQIFKFMYADHITVEGMELDGNAQDAAREYIDPLNQTWDGNHTGLSFYGSKDYLVKDMYIHHFGADGIYIGGGPPPANPPKSEPINPTDRPARLADRSVRVHNVRMANNGRQAMTVVQARDVWLSNSQFLDTGRVTKFGQISMNYRPVEPSAGIDIEPNFFDLARDSTNNRETGSYDDKKIDVVTGDILIENSRFARNVGAQLTAVLGRPINPYIKADGTCCDSVCSAKCAPPWNSTNNSFGIWPHPRVENVTIRFSDFQSASDSSQYVIALAARNGILEHSLVNAMETPNGKIYLTFHGGSSTGPNKNDELITTTIRKNTIFSNDEGILYAHWARHPIEISQNLIRGTATMLTPEIVPSAVGEKKILHNFWSIPVPSTAWFSPLSALTPSSSGKSIMRLFANVFENNTYCLSGMSDESFGCTSYTDADREKGYGNMDFASPRLSQNEEYRSGCLLRPFASFTSCTTTPYIFNYP